MEKTIMIVEDDAFIQELTAKKLEKAGYKVLTVQNGQDAVKVAGEEKLDLVICDLVIPHLDGFEVISKLRNLENTKTTPIVVFSNLADSDALGKATAAGATKFLIKSNFSLSDVVTEVISLIGAA
jgi:two-component system alkaline phosphatase synthesis response regulator PhoP